MYNISWAFRITLSISDPYEKDVAAMTVPMVNPIVCGVATCAAQACCRERMAYIEQLLALVTWPFNLESLPLMQIHMREKT